MHSGQSPGRGASAEDTDKFSACPDHSVDSLRPLVTAEQFSTMQRLSTKIALDMVQAAGLRLLDTESEEEVRSKLLIAVWAGEQSRCMQDLDSLSSYLRCRVCTALGSGDVVRDTEYPNHVWKGLERCRKAIWALQPVFSNGMIE